MAASRSGAAAACPDSGGVSHPGQGAVPGAAPAAVPWVVRVPQPGELPVLRDIERAAGRCFADIGMRAVAEDEPMPVPVLDGYRASGRAWVACVPASPAPVAYLLAETVDGNIHIEQVSVHPDAAGRGIGAALVAHVASWAAARGAAALTLTTFRDVPWNAPYYRRRLGFRILADGELTPGLRAVRAREGAAGLDRWPRVCMRRDL